MKNSRSSNKWGSLYLLVALGMIALFWEESLKIGSTEHEILASVIVLLLGYLIIRWINHHHENFIDPEAYKTYNHHPIIYRQNNDDSERTK